MGRVAYGDALALQRALFANRQHEYLLLMEHQHVVTTTKRTPPTHLLADIAAFGADLIETDRGGDVTYHGPGQLVAYPIVEVPGQRGGGMADTAAYVATLEQILIDCLSDVGVVGQRLRGCRGVWVDTGAAEPAKIAAIGARISRGRAMHGVALNVNPDLAWFERIVPCGVADKGVTSLAELGIRVSMPEIVEVFTEKALQVFAKHKSVDHASVGFKPTQGNHGTDQGPYLPPETYVSQAEGTSLRLLGRLAQAGVAEQAPLPMRSRKPEWLRVKFDPGNEYRRVKSTLRDLELVTVCEEAACPNISECWNDGTATFMILGERCPRACGFCLVDTRAPLPPDPSEPQRVAQAVESMALRHTVVTMVARDDLDDGGAAAVACVVQAIRARVPQCQIETLVSDFKGCRAALSRVFDARPDVFNHNIETVARLQRAVRPSASYARSLAVLAHAKAAGLTTKSSVIVGMGERDHEVRQTLIDLAAIGVDIVTIGQYLRPSVRHLPVAQWWQPKDFDDWKRFGERHGIGHVESSPLTRSSYHARQAAEQLRPNSSGRSEIALAHV